MPSNKQKLKRERKQQQKIDWQIRNFPPAVKPARQPLLKRLFEGIFTRENVFNLVANTFVFAFFLTIGIIAPGFWLAVLFHSLRVFPYEPHFYHAILAALCCIPLGALLSLLGVKNNGKYFVPMMMAMFCYGLLLPLIVGAVFAFIIRIIIGGILGVDLFNFSIVVYILLTIASISYGIYFIFQAVESGGIYEAQSSVLNKVSSKRTSFAPVVEAIVLTESDSSSDSDSDSGSSDSGSSDSGGDGD